MDRESVKSFIAEVLGQQALREAKDTGKWVSIHCPLAPWRHANGRDKTPSAGISVNDGGNSIFNCYSCHAKGPLGYLLRKLEQYTGEDWSELIDTIEDDELFAAHIPEWSAAHSSEELVPMTPVPEDHIDFYEPLDPRRYHPYLRKRGIPYATAIELELRIDPEDSEGEERILFPVRGVDGTLYGFTGRATHKDARLKVRDYFGLPKRRLLLGAHAVPEDAEYIILVEGLFDYALLRSWGLPALAFMSSTLTEAQVELVKEIGLPVYFFHDNDDPGIDARDRAVEALCRFVPMMGVKYPKRKVRDEKTGKMRPLKDPAELQEEEALHMIATADPM